MSENGKSYLFRHKQVRRFKVGKFEFNNFTLRLGTEKDREEFLEIVQSLPARDSNQIVEVNEAAAAAAETSVVQAQRVVHGAMGSEHILTEKDKARLQEAQNAQHKGEGVNGPQTGQPVGVAGLGAAFQTKK